MKLKKLYILALTFCFCLPVVVVAQNFKYKFQSNDNAGSFAFKVQERWAKNVNIMSGGRILIDVLPTDSIVKHTEILNAVSSGLLDGQITSLEYFAGRDPAFGLIGNTVGAWSDPNDLLLFMEHGGGNELVSDLLKPYGLTSLGSYTTTVESFVSKVPLDGVADLKGLKLRAPEGLVNAVFAAAGADPVNLPGSEVFTSLDKGVIQAADYSAFSTNAQQGLNKIAPNPVYPGFHSLPLNNISINTNKYNKLPNDLKAILKESVIVYSRDLIATLQMKDLQAVAKAKLDPNITVHNWSPEERSKFRAIAKEEWKKYSEKSPNAEKVYNVITKYLKDQGML